MRKQISEYKGNSNKFEINWGRCNIICNINIFTLLIFPIMNIISFLICWSLLLWSSIDFAIWVHTFLLKIILWYSGLFFFSIVSAPFFVICSFNSSYIGKGTTFASSFTILIPIFSRLIESARMPTACLILLDILLGFCH